MEINKTNLTEAELANIKMPYHNLVLVEIPQAKEEQKTVSGIIVGFNKDIQYAEGKDNHIADVADVYGRVVKVPEKFYFKRNDSFSPSWRSTIEIKEDDLVWFNPMAATNCAEIRTEESVYRLIPYDDMFVAKRRRWVSKFDSKWVEDVICLNGYCIIEKVKQKSLGSLDVLSEAKIDETRGHIKYCGSCNIEYENKTWTDFEDLEEGDEVLFLPGTKPIPLERQGYNAHFDNGKLYYAVQRRFIAMVI